MADEAKKIIIDEDWKSQVQAEKEAANQPKNPAAASEPPTSLGGDTVAGDSPAGEMPSPEEWPDDPEMPPASFEMLLTGLATEAMMSMGQIPNPITGESKVRKNQAKYLIDTIEVLRDKSKGNLEAAEDQAIEGLLHQLRMAFVHTAQ